MTPTHPERSCTKQVKCNSCGRNSHLAKFCVRKSQEKQGRIYAMEYKYDSEGEESSDEEENETREVNNLRLSNNNVEGSTDEDKYRIYC